MKIGLLPLYLALYDKCRPDIADEIRSFSGKIAKKLEDNGFEVIVSPACRLKNEFAQAVELFENSNCQAVVTLHLAYSPSLESIDSLAGTSLPIVVIDTTPDFEFDPSLIMPNHGIHGVQDMCNLLLRRKKPFLISAGHWEHSDCLERISRQLKSAAMAYRMTHARVGKVGGDFEGMGDFRVPEGTFNMEIVQYTPQPEPTAGDIEAEMARDKEMFQLDESVTQEAHIRTLNASLKIRNWIEKENLHAFTIAFPGIDRKEGWQTVPFLECSKAMSRGIGYAGEGDVLTAAATRCLAEIFPETSFTEMFCPDWKNNRIFTSHMGEINPDICSEKPLLHEQNYIFSDTGKPLVATGCFKAGKAILTDLAPGPDGTFNLIAAEVEYVIAQPGSQKCNTGWFVPRSGDIAAFLEQYSKAGGTHHLTCSYNGTLEIIRDWALLMNWNFVEIN